jgi:cobalt-precorrin-5B (C1)-methyltransferase
MILVFGGTTEGRKAAETLEESGSTYFYSTKTGEQDIVLHHGVRIDGALTAEDMQAFCREQGVRLIVDAAHPFAERLHLTIAQVSLDLQIPIVRYERIYPPRNPDITWINDYSDLDYILPSLSREGQGVGRLLATTGVQSIFKLKHLEELGIKFIYRILNRESSIVLAHQQGATDDQLCYYEDGGMPSADAILMKESGISGGFVEKVAEARAKGMRIIVIKRPEGFMKNGTWFTVNGPYGLRRIVEKLLPEFFPLHSGLTTGTCATAAAIADTIRLIKGETPAEVPVLLPDGETILVPVGYTDGYAYCIKEAGDDPDVTDGIEVRAKVEPANCFEILGGEGVGRFTLPGFDYPPGEAAINKGPREMMRQNIKENVRLTISVAGGDEIAKRTFNPRLGIEGGISIIGVSGIVKPFSEEAFIDSIRKCMTVAKASGTDSVVINSGAKSERFLKALYPNLPQQAFVQYGNYIGETLKMADELHIPNITLGVMLGKAVKLAEGQLDTHSRKSTMNIGFIQKMLNEAHIEISLENITLARDLWEKIPRDQLPTFCNVVIRHCETYCKPLLPNGHLTILLISDDGTIHSL